VAFGAAYQDPNLPLFGPAVEISQRSGRTLVTGAWETWVSKNTLAFRAGANADEIGGGVGYQFRLLSKMMMRFDYAILWPLNIDGTNGSHRVSISASF
jgi:protein-L-isoaspartate O-methyltransferase